MENVARRDGNTAGDVVEVAGERAKGPVDAGVHAVRTLSGRACDTGHRANGYVRENRWMMLGAAVGVGIVLGFVLRGRPAS